MFVYFDYNKIEYRVIINCHDKSLKQSEVDRQRSI